VIGTYLKYMSLALFLAITWANPVLALSTTPEKPQNASLSLGVEYASGNYGTGSNIRSFYMPLIATWSPTDRLDVGIEIPFLYQSSPSVTTELYNASLSTTTAETTPSGAAVAGYSGARGSSRSGVSGLGDIILRLGVIALAEDSKVPQLRPSLYVKCPSADVSKGLGTGEFDFGVGIEASKWLGNAQLIGEGFYTFQGKAEGFNLQDYLSYTAAVGYQVTENIKPMLMVRGATAPTTVSGVLLEARARVIWTLTGNTSLDLYGSRGIADASPEYGGGLAVIYAF